MSLADYNTARKERLARLGALPPRPSIAHIIELRKPPKPVDHDAGWEGMWFWDLVEGHSKEPRQVRIQEIQQAVAKYYGLSILDLLSQRRARHISLPRQIAMYLCRMMTPHSYAQIGRRFGGRDHTTVIHASQKFEGLYGFDLKATCDINAIKKALA